MTLLQPEASQGQRALVAGGCSGIGVAVCRALAAAGARVAVNDLSSREETDLLVNETIAEGGVRRYRSRAMSVARMTSSACSPR